MAIVKDKNFKNTTRISQRNRLYSDLQQILSRHSKLEQYDKLWTLGIIRTKIKEGKL